MSADPVLVEPRGATGVFGTPIDITLSERALECFYPADAATAEALRTLAGRSE